MSGFGRMIHRRSALRVAEVPLEERWASLFRSMATNCSVLFELIENFVCHTASCRKFVFVL